MSDGSSWLWSATTVFRRLAATVLMGRLLARHRFQLATMLAILAWPWVAVSWMVYLTTIAFAAGRFTTTAWLLEVAIVNIIVG